MVTVAFVVAASLVVFAAVGVVVAVRAVRAAAAEGRAHGRDRVAGGWRARAAGYTGAVSPASRGLNPPARVVVELFAGACGFPGLGWMLSGCLLSGLLLITCVPAVVWGLYPAYLALTGGLTGSALSIVGYVPFIGLASACGLAVREIAAARRDEDGARP